MKFILVLLVLFNLGDESGNEKQVNSDMTVYFFLSPQCTICNFYVPSIRELHEKFNKQYNFVAVFPNNSTSKEAMETFQLETKLSFPFVLDHDKMLTTQLGAEITPQAIVFNHNTNQIHYRGRIDDIYVALGKRKNEVAEFSLFSFLDSFIQNPTNTLITNKSIGCLINYADDK